MKKCELCDGLGEVDYDEGEVRPVKSDEACVICCGRGEVEEYEGELETHLEFVEDLKQAAHPDQLPEAEREARRASEAAAREEGKRKWAEGSAAREARRASMEEFDRMKAETVPMPEDGVFVRRVTVEIIRRAPVVAEHEPAISAQFHSGGVVGSAGLRSGEVPALMSKGEEVFDLYTAAARMITAQWTDVPFAEARNMAKQTFYAASFEDIDDCPGLGKKDFGYGFTMGAVAKVLKPLIANEEVTIEEKQESAGSIGSGAANFIFMSSQSDLVPGSPDSLSGGSLCSVDDDRRFFTAEMADGQEMRYDSSIDTALYRNADGQWAAFQSTKIPCGDFIVDGDGSHGIKIEAQSINIVEELAIHPYTAETLRAEGKPVPESVMIRRNGGQEVSRAAALSSGKKLSEWVGDALKKAAEQPPIRVPEWDEVEQVDSLSVDITVPSLTWPSVEFGGKPNTAEDGVEVPILYSDNVAEKMMEGVNDWKRERGDFCSKVVSSVGVDRGSREEVVDRLEVERSVSVGEISLREPILVNVATTPVDVLFSELLSELGMTRMQELAELTSQEWERRNGWLNTEEKVAEAGIERVRLNSVEVVFGHEASLSVIVRDEEAVARDGLSHSKLMCPQAKGDDDAYAIGMMFLKGPQDPAEFPLMAS